MKSHYKRIILKLSGEALIGDEPYGIDPKVLDRIASEVGELVHADIQVGMVIGGGNICRGKALSNAGLGRVSADQIGMLATVMNAIAMRDALERAGFSTRILSAIPMSSLVEPFDRRKAISLLNHGNVVIFSAGTGNPLVTTDSAASLRAIETEADILLKATNVDGIYSADPLKDKNAKRYDKISYTEVLEKELGVMDLSAFCQCRDHNMPIRVFDINAEGALMRIMQGEAEGTLVDRGTEHAR